MRILRGERQQAAAPPPYRNHATRIGFRRRPIDRRVHLSSESVTGSGSLNNGGGWCRAAVCRLPGCDQSTGGPSTSCSARSAADRCRVACSCRVAVSLASAAAIAKERLTSADCRECDPDGQRMGRGCRKMSNRSLNHAGAQRDRLPGLEVGLGCCCGDRYGTPESGRLRTDSNRRWR